MKQSEADRIVSSVSGRYGVPFHVELNQSSKGSILKLQPEGLHKSEGFQVRVEIGWKSLQFKFIPGSFAGGLIAHMGMASRESQAQFSTFIRLIVDDGGRLNMSVNGEDIDPFMPDLWPSKWETIALDLRKSPVEINTEDHIHDEKLVSNWIERFVGAIISLLPLEEAQEESTSHGLPEGAKKRVEVNRYERSKINRALCIEAHGCCCKVCGFDFEEKYGAIGGGFIHVHHITPVSKLEEAYVIDPVNELVPVCPNCHSMLHKKEPPVSIHQLKKLIKVSEKNKQ